VSDEAPASDEERMLLAIAEADAALGHDDVPVGAVVFDASGMLLGRGHNRREQHHDPTAHAEIEALALAARARSSWRLDDCVIYVTLEPCLMCAGAMVNARIARLVYGCRDEKAGAIDSLFVVGRDPRLNHRFAVTSGIHAAACAERLKTFFARRR
jgi:tRNA(adenine34) deaminase